ncbi:MAG: type II toxin-antitoxin system HicA family toxin [Gammaproteobacteria bacterium]|nr:type II toxin-antitoxin system HicA family toxin [Candidatus Poribacteria bacterium]MYG08895.1 type II toxin-antitoxin system HicA family toxin [Candidatus Poribacteria bacterium]MYK43868.1 type II toxin-antitoxin system HicA family toxin [Gammaproteobacteria bacterium]
MKRRELIKHLKDHGCKLLREGGSHSRWWNPVLRTRTSVPRHTEINNITAQKICKALGIPRPLKKS